MSISAEHIRICAEDFEQLLRNPALIEVFLGNLYPQENEYYELLRKQGRTCVIGTNWQALHYLLTGEVSEPGKSQIASPLARAVMGGHPVQFQDYVDTERYLTPDEVIEIAQALIPLSREKILAKYQQYKTSTVYIYRKGSPTEWDEGLLDSLIDYYSNLRDFYIHAANEGDAILISIG